MHQTYLRTAALIGSVLLFLAGFGWYLSMGLWNFPTQNGFQYLAEDPAFQAAYSREAGPYPLSFPFQDPRQAQGEVLCKGPWGAIRVTRVDSVTDTSCRLWFEATGKLSREGGTLVSACLPQGEKEALLFCSLQAEEGWHAYLSTYDAALGERGHQFAVTVFSEAPPREETEVTLTFSDLPMVTYTRAE